MTTIGDISFGAKFIDKDDKTPEILIEGNNYLTCYCALLYNYLVIVACRVPSDVEPIMGSFKSRREGTLILTFDNSFSWFNPKLLTYKVALFQVSVFTRFRMALPLIAPPLMNSISSLPFLYWTSNGVIAVNTISSSLGTSSEAQKIR